MLDFSSSSVRDEVLGEVGDVYTALCEYRPKVLNPRIKNAIVAAQAHARLLLAEMHNLIEAEENASVPRAPGS